MNGFESWDAVWERVWDDFTGIFVVEAVLKIVLIVLATLTVAKVGKIIIKKIFRKRKNSRLSENKLCTLQTIVLSGFRYLVYGVGILTVLADVFHLRTVLATAGVGGIALAFGAQSLVRDVIAGFFILVEDQFDVGDRVTIGEMTGEVEWMELRITRFRNGNGELYIVSNGEIKAVTNHSRGERLAVVDVPLAYGVDVKTALSLAEEVCHAFDDSEGVLVDAGRPEVLGINAMDKDHMLLRIAAKTEPGGQFEVERRLRAQCTEMFAENGIVLGSRVR